MTMTTSDLTGTKKINFLRDGCQSQFHFQEAAAQYHYRVS
jgi:hypothetical protein